MNIGHVKFIKPKSPKLASLIKGYYVHACNDLDFYTKVTFYQNITTTISIYKNSRTTAKERARKQYYTKNNKYQKLLVGLVDKYQEVSFYGPLDRLAIVFHPLGINHFIQVPLSKLLQKHYSNFSYFEDEFNSFLDTVYSESSLEKKRDLLDTFFLKHYTPFKEPQLVKAVDLLLHNEASIKVEELAKHLNLSRRTLLRKFKKHTGYTVEEYMAVIKFRKALFNYQQNRESFQLTQIALDSNYYDQADFNHQIKHRSDLTPKELFTQLNLIDNTLFWKL